MADDYPVIAHAIARAIADLEIETAETRSAVYDNARAAQSSQLRAIDPPLAFAARRRERIALEEVISRIEAERVSKQRYADIDDELFAPSAPRRPSALATRLRRLFAGRKT